MSKARLHGIEGLTVLSGTDDHGCKWIQFEVDCTTCGAALENSWQCLDDGDEVCCVELPVAEGYKHTNRR